MGFKQSSVNSSDRHDWAKEKRRNGICHPAVSKPFCDRLLATFHRGLECGSHRTAIAASVTTGIATALATLMARA